MNRAQHQMMKIVQKISVFVGLTLEQAQSLIQVFKVQQYETGDTVYEVGESGDEMLVLIRGRLSVLSATGRQLGEVPPGQATGEMGLFTGHKRSATIVAIDDCIGLTVNRTMLFSVIEQDPVMKGTILENVVSLMSARLAEANTRLDQLSQSAAAAPEPEP